MKHKATNNMGQQLQPDSRHGATAVELLVVMLIVTLLAVGLTAAISSALTLQQNAREESDVRTTLALQLAYAEQYLSLANAVNEIVSTNAMGMIVTNHMAFFPRETGGVSFETNHWMRVTSNMFFRTNLVSYIGGQVSTNDALVFRIFSGDDRRTSQDRKFSAFGMQRGSRAYVTEAKLEGGGPVRRLTLSAEFPVRKRGGTVTNETISVSRPIRLWNQ